MNNRQTNAFQVEKVTHLWVFSHALPNHLSSAGLTYFYEELCFIHMAEMLRHRCFRCLPCVCVCVSASACLHDRRVDPESLALSSERCRPIAQPPSSQLLHSTFLGPVTALWEKLVLYYINRSLNYLCIKKRHGTGTGALKEAQREERLTGQWDMPLRTAEDVNQGPAGRDASSSPFQHRR